MQAALVETWRIGLVERRIDRPRSLGRTVYGWAGYDLLRRRVLDAV